jgi:hypothetical protein
MKKFGLIFAVALFFILGLFGVINNVIDGHPIQATLISMPILMVSLAIIFPGRGPGHFALTHEFGPIREVDESEKQFLLKMAKWWFLGFITSLLPLLIAFFFPGQSGVFVGVGGMVAIILGIPCLIKCFGSLFKAIK